MLMDKNADNIQVMVRVRPFNSRERAEDSKACVIVDEDRPNSIMLDAKPDSKTFNFDWVGGERTMQQEIFEVVGKPMVQTCLQGYNCCIFAYGQTGAGKTFTMQGRGLEMDNEDITYRGLQPRVFDYIFSTKASDTQLNPNVKYLISCTYLEIYNEQIVDLLEPVGSTLQIREDLKKGVYVEGLKEEVVENSEDTIELLRKGAINRHVGSTNMNAESSRSHSLFTMNIERKQATGGTVQVRTSKFHFVDLAGSERQKSTAAAGERLKEAGNINKSLSVLGQVINSLVEISEGKQRHIRYRDSKLTFILKDSLGGNSKTFLIANVSPASSSFAETLSTLKFAQRAKQIKNKASINEDSSGNLEGLKNEIRQLKEEIAQYKRTIASIETEQKKIAKSPKVTPFSGNFGLGLDGQKSLMEQNQRSLETERLLKEALEVLTENEFLLQAELAKKEEYINTFKSAVEMHNDHEMHYRTVLELNQSRMERLVHRLTSSDPNKMEEEEFGDLKKEIQALLQIVKGSPAIMKTYMQNIDMRERIDTLEAEINPNSSVSVARQLQENLVFLQELTFKLDENIRERKALSEKLERMGPAKGGLGSPEKNRRLEDDIRTLKMEHNQQIDKLNFEILELKQREIEARRIAEIEAKKHADISKEYENLRELKQRNEEKYEKKINEVYQEFERIQNTRFNVDGLEKTIDQLNLKNLELKDQMLSYREKYEDMMHLYQEMEECIKTTLNEKEEAENMFRNELNKTNIEKGVLENTVSSLENRMNLILEDLNMSKNELNELTKTLAELYSKENEYKLSLDSLYQENMQLQEKYARFEERKNSDMIQLQTSLDKQRLKAETIDAERAKIQEELDTLNQTFNYNVNELEEKKIQLSDLQARLNEHERRFIDVSEEAKRQQEYSVRLEKQIFEHQKENSPANIALRENVELKENMNQLRLTIRNYEEELQRKMHELEDASNRMIELNASVQHYTTAYKDAYNKLEAKSNELRDVQTALDSKLLEFAELEQEFRSSNENTMKKESEILELKNNINKLNNNISQLEMNIHESEAEKKKLYSELQFKATENGLLAGRASENAKKVVELETELNNLKLSHLNELEELADNLILLKTTCDNKSNEVHTLTMDLKEAEERAKLFEERLGNLNQATQQLQDEKFKLEALIEEIRAETNNKVQTLQSSLESSEKRAKTLQGQLNDSIAKSSLYEDELLEKEELLREKEASMQEEMEKVRNYERELKESHEQFNASTLEIQKIMKKVAELERSSSEKDEALAELSSKIKERLQEIHDLENKIYMMEENLKEQKLGLEKSSAKVGELEKTIVAKDTEIGRIHKDANLILEKKNDLEKELAAKKDELGQQTNKVNEYVNKISQMEKLLQDQQRNSTETINNFRKEMERQQAKSAEERNALIEGFAPREQAYQQQIEELTKDLNVALQDLSAERSKPKELQSKIQTLEKEMEEKDLQLKEYIDGMLQMKNQLDGYIELINQLNELPKMRQENTRLKSELKKQEELILKLNLQAAEHFKQQEEEINRIKDSYSKLENQHQFIMATASLKDSEATKSREEIRLMLTEKEKLLSEIIKLRENEAHWKKLKEESDDEVKRINNEKLAILVQMDSLDKTNSQLAGHNNFKQKVDHLTKIKEENTKLRDEKMRLQDKFNKSQEKSEQLQKKLDDLAKKRNIDPTKIDSDLNDAQYLQIELDKIKIENRLLYDAASKINQLLNVNFYYRKNTPFNHSSKDLNKTLDGVQELINVLMEKEKEIREREREIEAKRLHHNIIERELAVIKQKYQLNLANQDLDPAILRENTENKENVELIIPENKPLSKKSEAKIENLSVFNSGGKRSFHDMAGTGNKGRPLTNQANKGKASIGKHYRVHDPQNAATDLQKAVDDITNQDFGREEDFRKKIKHN